MQKTAHKKIVIAVANALSVMWTSAVYADASRLEEVVVTAQKREETLQTVPLAISALTGEQLTNRGITSFEGVALASPSVTFVNYASSTNTLTLYMRAQGIADPGQVTNDGSVGFYEDGFYIARPQAITFDLADVERVEVLRGPQGTLYGRNTIGGAVNLISKRPTGEFGFKESLTFGTRNQFRSLTAIDLPQWNDLAAKLTVLKSSKDGYVKNSGSSHDYGEEAQLAGRLALHWENNSGVAVDYFGESGSLDSTPAYFQNPWLNGETLYGNIPYSAKNGPQRRTYRAIDLQPSSARFEGHGLTVTWDLSDALTIKSLTGYRKLTAQQYQDYAEAIGGSEFNTLGGYSDHQFSQEFQFIGSLLDDAINYVAGLYYYDEGGSHDMTVVVPAYSANTMRRVKASSKSEAAYGQLTWTPDILDQRLELTLGARYTHDKKAARRYSTEDYGSGVTVVENGRDPGSINNLSFSRFNPSFTANFHWTPDLSVYGKIATGYKAGGSYESAPLGSFNQTYGPEKLVNYEVGFKSYWLDQTVRLNVAAFDSKLEDKQLGLFVDPNLPTEAQAFNAGEMRIKGVELEFLVAPTADLSLSLDYTYLDAAFTNVDAVPGTILNHATNPASPYNTGDNLKHLFVATYAPKNSLVLNADYTFLHFASGDVSLHMDYKWQDAWYGDYGASSTIPNSELLIYPSYGVFGARLTSSFNLSDGHQAKISLWGKNIFNKQYPAYTIAQGGPMVPVENSGGVVVPTGYTSRAVAWSEPPSYGIDFQYQY